MEQTFYDDLCKREGAIAMAHPQFPIEYHTELWSKFPVTLLMCQRQTKEFTQLAIESFLRFYPDFKILIVDDESGDDSALYLRYKEITNPNFKVYWRSGKAHSHGDMLNEAMTQYIDTPYVLMMDSDTITNRGGWVEQLLEKFTDNNLYAVGTLMLVTESGEAIGSPKDENDVLRYAHPSCAMYDVEKYRGLFRASDHGSPLALNMIDAKKKGYEVNSFPIENYVSHLSGTSWVKEHQIIWKHDYNVFLRPFLTFVFTEGSYIGGKFDQTENDYDVIFSNDKMSGLVVWLDKDIDINNNLYPIRNRIVGEYVCVVNSTVPIDFVTRVKQTVNALNAPDELEIEGIKIYKRNFFQSTLCLYAND